jgi:hypothetical protein
MTDSSLSVFEVVVSIEPLEDPNRLSIEDCADPILCNGGMITYLVVANGTHAAENIALDEFHQSIPIKTLDDFYINATPTALSSHRIMELKKGGDLPSGDLKPIALEHHVSTNEPRPRWFSIKLSIRPIGSPKQTQLTDIDGKILTNGGRLHYMAHATNENDAAKMAKNHFSENFHKAGEIDFEMKFEAEMLNHIISPDAPDQDTIILLRTEVHDA